MSELHTPQILFVIFAEPGTHVTEREWLEWCDEQIPPRLTMNSEALLYKNTDSSEERSYVVISSLEVLPTDANTSPRQWPFQHAPHLLSRISKFECCECQVIFTHECPNAPLLADYVFTIEMELHASDEEAYQKRYFEEYVESVSELPEWLRGRSCKCLSRKVLGGQGHTGRASTTATVSYLTIDEFDDIPDDNAPHDFNTSLMGEGRITSGGLRKFELYKIFKSPKLE